MSPGVHAAVVLLGALAVDLAIGEPPVALHPVVWMGRLQRALRRLAPVSRSGAFAWGLLMAGSGPLLFGGGAWLLLHALAPWPLVRLGVEIYLLKCGFAVRALAEAALAVGEALARGDLEGARSGLRSLVSRDTSRLGAPLLAAAAVESVAENASDSFVAPLFYFVLFGLPGALAYRAANTLDALVGYRGGDTEWLGKAGARLDDLANLAPARLTAALLVPAAWLCRASGRGALRGWWRDGALTESPNAGRPMAAMAGALGVRLEKVGHYRLGRGVEPGGAEVGRAVALLWVTCAIAAAIALAWLGVLHAPFAEA